MACLRPFAGRSSMHTGLVRLLQPVHSPGLRPAGSHPLEPRGSETPQRIVPSGVRAPVPFASPLVSYVNRLKIPLYG